MFLTIYGIYIWKLRSCVTLKKSITVIFLKSYANGLTKRIRAPVFSSTIGKGFINLNELSLNLALLEIVNEHTQVLGFPAVVV